MRPTEILRPMKKPGRMRASANAKKSPGKPGDLERAKGIEPSYSAWEADVLPLNYARILNASLLYCWKPEKSMQGKKKLFAVEKARACEDTSL